MTPYQQAFIDTCARNGVDPRALAKCAAESDSVADKGKETVGKIKEKGSEIADKVKDKGSEVADKAKGAVTKGVDSAKKIGGNVEKVKAQLKAMLGNQGAVASAKTPFEGLTRARYGATDHNPFFQRLIEGNAENIGDEASNQMGNIRSLVSAIRGQPAKQAAYEQGFADKMAALGMGQPAEEPASRGAGLGLGELLGAAGLGAGAAIGHGAVGRAGGYAAVAGKGVAKAKALLSALMSHHAGSPAVDAAASTGSGAPSRTPFNISYM